MLSAESLRNRRRCKDAVTSAKMMKETTNTYNQQVRPGVAIDNMTSPAHNSERALRSLGQLVASCVN